MRGRSIEACSERSTRLCAGRWGKRVCEGAAEACEAERVRSCLVSERECRRQIEPKIRGPRDRRVAQQSDSQAGRPPGKRGSAQGRPGRESTKHKDRARAQAAQTGEEAGESRQCAPAKTTRSVRLTPT